MAAATTGSWAVVLAAGDGTRLSDVTRDADGAVVPKQFFSFGGAPSLLGATLARAWAIVPRERVVVVVAEAHRRWWERELADLDDSQIVVQPDNRGTGVGLLLPLLRIFVRDPAATACVLPSDHGVARERVLRDALAGALDACRAGSARIALLGMPADAPATDYGWIVPETPFGEDGAPRRVEAFEEKPTPARARELLDAGAAWSSFIMAGSVQSFVRLHARHAPLVLAQLLACGEMGRDRSVPTGVRAAFAQPGLRCDFSHDILQPAAASLDVVLVEPCGWTDLGTPERVARWLSRGTGRPRAAAPVPIPPGTAAAAS